MKEEIRKRAMDCVGGGAEGRVHTCSGREPDSRVPGARVRFASTWAKNRPAVNRSRPVKLKPVSTLRPERFRGWPDYMLLISE